MVVLLVLHPLGIALAVAFATLLTSVLWWMLHIPSPVSVDVARAVHSIQGVRRIMVPIMDRFYSERAVELACRLAQGQPAKIVLVSVIEVPRTMPLAIPLPALEQEGAKEIADGLTIVKRHGLIGESTTLRTREAGEGIARASVDFDADLVVLGVRADRGMIESIFTRVTTLLLRRAPCEVLLDFVPEGALPVKAPPSAQEEVHV